MKASILSKKKFAPFVVGAFCLVFAAAQPVATVSAQLSLQDTLQSIKEKVKTEIEKNITKLKDSQSALSVSIKIDKDGVKTEVTGKNGSAKSSVGKDGVSGEVKSSKGGSASGSVTKDGASGEVKGSKGGSATGSVSKDGASGEVKGSSGGNISIDVSTDGITSDLNVPNNLKVKLQEANDKAIEKLTSLKEKIESADTVAKAKAAAKEFDENVEDFMAAHVQARVTKAIDTMTKVLEALQSAQAKIQTQVTKIKECINGIKSGEGTLDANASAGNGNGGVSVTATAPGCDDLNVELHRDDVAAALQKKLDEAKSSMQTIRSFLSSSIGLIAELKEGNFNGTLESFDGISEQLDIVLELSASVKDSLVEVALSVRKA